MKCITVFLTIYYFYYYEGFRNIEVIVKINFDNYTKICIYNKFTRIVYTLLT